MSRRFWFISQLKNTVSISDWCNQFPYRFPIAELFKPSRKYINFKTSSVIFDFCITILPLRLHNTEMSNRSGLLYAKCTTNAHTRRKQLFVFPLHWHYWLLLSQRFQLPIHSMQQSTLSTFFSILLLMWICSNPTLHLWKSVMRLLQALPMPVLDRRHCQQSSSVME